MGGRPANPAADLQTTPSMVRLGSTAGSGTRQPVSPNCSGIPLTRVSARPSCFGVRGWLRSDTGTLSPLRTAPPSGRRLRRVECRVTGGFVRGPMDHAAGKTPPAARNESPRPCVDAGRSGYEAGQAWPVTPRSPPLSSLVAVFAGDEASRPAATSMRPSGRQTLRQARTESRRPLPTRLLPSATREIIREQDDIRLSC